MSIRDRLSRFWRAWRERHGLESELETELRFHLERETERRVAAGTAREVAARQARLAFGPIERMREECRDAWGARRLDELGRDLRLALRAAARQPVQTAFLVLVLAAGTGAATANFGVVRAYLWTPPAFRDAASLVHLYRYERRPAEKGRFALPDVEALARESRTLDEVGAYYYGGVNLRRTGGEPIRTMAAFLTPNLLDLLGVRPELGRGTGGEDMASGSDDVVLIGDALHRELFAGRRDALGATLYVDGEPKTVVGVLPRGFGFPFGEVRLWLPVDPRAPSFSTEWENFQPVARLRAGVTRAAAAAELGPRMAAIETGRGLGERGSRVDVWPLREALIFEYPLVRAMMWLLTASHLALLLLIASTVGGILLARLRVRERDLAVRTALGAGRARVVAQLVTEAGAVVLVGALAGVGFALWLTPRVARGIPEALYRAAEPRIDLPALLFTLAAVVSASVFAAVLPALRATQVGPADALRRAGGVRSGRRSHRMRDGLVLVQFAAAALLAIVAVVLESSVATMRHGADRLAEARVVTLEVDLPTAAYEGAERVGAVHDEMLRELDAEPAIAHASLVNPLPLNFETYGLAVEIAGPEGAAERAEVAYHRTSPGFFDAFGQPLLSGRDFDGHDRAGAPPVAIVNQAFRTRYLGDGPALGRSLRRAGANDGETEWLQIVGVVGDSPTQSFARAGEPTVYLPMAQKPGRRAFLVVAAAGDPADAARALRATLRRIDPDLPTTHVRALPEVLRDALAPWRTGSQGVGGLALFALALASLGLHGVVSQVVAERRFELGLRAALGADRRRLVRLVLGQGLHLVVAGALVGGVLSVATYRLLQSILTEIAPGSIAAAAAAPLLLGAVAIVAMLGPALRAARVDPATTLRAE